MLEANNYSDALQEATEKTVAKEYATKGELSELGQKTVLDLADAKVEMLDYTNQRLADYYDKDDVNAKFTAVDGAVRKKADRSYVDGNFLPAEQAQGAYTVMPLTRFLGDIELQGVSGTFTDATGAAAITPYNDGAALGFTFSDGNSGKHSQLAPDGSKVLTQNLGDARYARGAAQLEISDGPPTAVEHGKFYCWRPSSTAPATTSISLEDNGLENEARLYLDYRTAASQISLPAGATVLYREGSAKLGSLALGGRYFADIQWFSTGQREGDWES